ncbi:MAG: hypothetical protein PHP53_11955 [Prolixibacteraceae bacterium]|nr:hypothetical protein [Prolixibacteraceae bacterium]
MKTRILILIIFLTTANKIFADAISYALSPTIRVESKKYIVTHFHDWSRSTNEARFKMISTDQNPFTSDNNYAYIECKEKSTGKVIFKKPCSALSRIEISKDEKYIIGISKIMLWNPYQMVIYSTNGELIKKRHIASQEAKLTKDKMEEFKRKYPKQYTFLYSQGRIYIYNTFFYIDFASMSMPEKLGKAWGYLFDFITNNHLSNSFSESVTNWVFWFYEANPDIIFNYSESGLTSISLLDPKQKRIEIKINE